MFGKTKSYTILARKIAITYNCLLVAVALNAQTGSILVSENSDAHSFPLATDKSISSIYYDAGDATVVKKAAESFSNDIYLVTGKKMPVTASLEVQSVYAVIAGTIGHSKFID